MTTLDTNEQTWNIHACCILIRACGILLAFPHFQGFHTLFHQEEQRSLSTGLPEMDRNRHSLGQNARSCVSAFEWKRARASRGYCFLPHRRGGEKSEIDGVGLFQSHCVFVENCLRLCRSAFLQNQPPKNCSPALFHRWGALTAAAADLPPLTRADCITAQEASKWSTRCPLVGKSHCLILILIQPDP